MDEFPIHPGEEDPCWGTQGPHASSGKQRRLAKPCQHQAQDFLDGMPKVLLEGISFLWSWYPSNSIGASLKGTK